MTRILAVRLDSDGDVLLTGPALRALAHGAARLDLLVSPVGEQAARLLPGPREIIVFDAPWSGYRPPQVDSAAITDLVARLRRAAYDRVVVFTSFHQSPLPMALLAKLADIPYVAATSEDYPGSLLDLRHRRMAHHEVDAALELAQATGARLPAGDDGRLAVLPSSADVSGIVPSGPLVVVHPGASVPARALGADHARRIVSALLDSGWDVAVTGAPAERDLARQATAPGAVDLTGRTSLAELAAVLRRAACLVAGNTGPAHLAAAVGTPVVSMFSPVVPVERWHPYGVPSVVLGDQDAACRDTRARECPTAGHPCLSEVEPAEVVAAVESLVTAGRPATTSAGAA
ncbi:MAG TPA: glycosyltransferase family 9 protein [Jiangellaceae bacterium]|nr:glycosyltransferase family 9 protein [Jiangellaceae bacterium]